MRFGVENVAGTTVPYMGWDISSTQAIDAMLGYASFNNGGNTNLNIGGKYTQVIQKIKNVNLNFSGLLGINSATAAGASTTTLTMIGALGAEYKVNDVLSIYGDIDLLTLQSMSGGATGTNIFLVTGDFNCYSGIRIYI